MIVTHNKPKNRFELYKKRHSVQSEILNDA